MPSFLTGLPGWSATVMAETPSGLSAPLSDGLAVLGLDLDAMVQARLLAYLGLLARWNRAYNLTAVRDPMQMVTRHLLDSLSILPWVSGEALVDVGTGPGLPGLPLAIACPWLHVSLVDANGKKVRFLRQVVMELGLANVDTVQSRAEDFHPPRGFDLITTRAFASLPDMIDRTRHLLVPGGKWLAMKSVSSTSELAALPAGIGYRVEPLRVPGDASCRLLVILDAGT
jgi:16S rRNA (guanine527-N7)-methyltransferase